jgi:predicted Fe-S protein YdhL (DUF1289 family)
MQRSTPCVGICSTTYGDLVCRGCKRFAHEIVGWNSYAEPQRDAIRARLDQLREGSVREHLQVTDVALMRASAERFVVPGLGDISDMQVAYAVLLRSRGSLADLIDMGVGPVPGSSSAHSPRDLLRMIDEEFMQRSRAHYERNYRIAAQ